MLMTNAAQRAHFLSLIWSPSGHLSLLFIFYFYLLLAVPYDMWDLSSLIRDRACAPAVEAWSLNHSCLFTLLIVYFIVQKLLSLIRSHLFIFALFPLLWEVGYRGSCCDLCQSVFCLCFPQRVV